MPTLELDDTTQALFECPDVAALTVAAHQTGFREGTRMGIDLAKLTGLAEPSAAYVDPGDFDFDFFTHATESGCTDSCCADTETTDAPGNSPVTLLDLRDQINQIADRVGLIERHYLGVEYVG